MLTRRRSLTGLLGMVLLASGALVAPVAVAAPLPAGVICNSSGICTVEAKAPGGGSSSQGSKGGEKASSSKGTPSKSTGGGGKGGGKAPACTEGGKAVDCKSSDGVWSNADACYWALQNPQDAPPPGKNAGDGAWYVCTSTENSLLGGTGAGYKRVGAPVWRDNGQAPPEVVQITPAQAAAQVVKTMKFTPVQTGLSMDVTKSSRWNVGIEQWMWIENAADKTARGPQTKTAVAGGVQVTANAKLMYVDYDMGDGTKKRCAPTSTKYYLQAGRKPAPSCGYVYEKMSPQEGKGTYRITATAHWDVEWTGEGQTGVIPMEVTSTRDIRVGEIQVLNVPTG